MKPDKHVQHLLVRYLNGQTSPRQTDRIRVHLAACQGCRARLHEHEHLLHDLMQVADAQGLPSSERIETWWVSIRARQQTSLRSRAQTMLISLLGPVLLSILVLSGLLATEVSSVQAAVSETQGIPYIDTTLEPTGRAFPFVSFDQPAPLHPTATAEIGGPILVIPVAPTPAQSD